MSMVHGHRRDNSIDKAGVELHLHACHASSAQLAMAGWQAGPPRRAELPGRSKGSTRAPLLHHARRGARKDPGVQCSCQAHRILSSRIWSGDKKGKNIRFASNNNALVRASCTKGPPDRRIFGLTHPTAGEYLTRFCFRPSTKLKLRCHARRINGGALVC